MSHHCDSWDLFACLSTESLIEMIKEPGKTIEGLF